VTATLEHTDQHTHPPLDEQLDGQLDGVALTFSAAAALAEEYADLAAEEERNAETYRARLEAIDVPVPAWEGSDRGQGGELGWVQHVARLDAHALRMRSLAAASRASAARAVHYRALTQRLHEHAGRVVTAASPRE
jgi:hypothetical protein